MESSATTAAERPVRPVDAPTKPRGGLLAALRKPAAGSSDSSAESEDDLSESDHETSTKAPRDTSTTTTPQTLASAQQDDEEDNDDGAAYERLKKRLAASKDGAQSLGTQSTENVVPVAVATMSSEDEDEMPIKATSHRSNVRRAKSKSPSASPATDVRSRHSSPGLFVTPNASPVKSRIPVNSASKSEGPQIPHDGDLQARVRRIRAERLAKKQEEEDDEAKQQNMKTSKRRVEQNSGSDTDGESGRRLTQQAKPTRRAGKKAMELMARDQQRISRNMQLTHQSKTKKKFPLNDLYSRFGMTTPHAEIQDVASLPTPDASSALASSDAEATQTRDTPPASPPKQQQLVPENISKPSDPTTIPSESLLPSTIADKGKGRAPEFQHLPPHPWMKQSEQLAVRTARTDVQKPADQPMVDLSDSDDELEVIQTESRFPAFDRMPLKKQQESSSLLHLRHLAQLSSTNGTNNTRKGQKTISLGEMQMSLARKAREQGQKERAEKIADLKRRGIHVETEEEREKNQMEVEDMVAQFEKQRQEDLKLAKSERKQAKENGETLDGLPSSDESDDDYVGSDEENANGVEGEADDKDEAELELSGSEDEDMEIETNADDAVDDESNGLVADMAEEENHDDADMEDEESSAPIRKRTSTRPRNIIIDEEDESDDEPPILPSPTHQATQDDAMAAFGFGNVAVGGLGFTQMFAGTMANLDSESQSAVTEPEQDSLDFLRGLPDTQPGANFSQASDFVVPNSQSLVSPGKTSQTAPETQFSMGISQLMKDSPEFSRTQVEDLPEPTQDAGFSFSRSPVGLAPPPSTVDTIMMSVSESPIKQNKGRLHRRQRDAPVELSDVEEDLADVEATISEEDDIQLPPKRRDAFAKLQKGARKQKVVDDFNKKTSLAKNAVMDQAEESEDEYAGLGGASDDDSGVEDEETNRMIEHGEVEVDERQLAAYFADKARKEDEKSMNELYKNVMNGGLRRRAGGRDGFDMSDSEDEDDIRLRKKRAEFQKMNKALLADERIGDIAKDQKKQAFFHTLADFADEGEYEFLNMPADLGVDGEQSQSQEDGQQAAQVTENNTVPDSQTVDASDLSDATNPLKRKSPSESQKENRPPPNLRRTAASDSFARKPITLADVQNSVLELLEDPRIMVPDSQFSESEEEDDVDDSQTRAATRKPIVDRLTLSRTSTVSEAEGSNLAFHAPSRGSNAPGFRVPSLIRQATSNLSATSDSHKSSSVPAESVRRGGTGKSNIHAQAREAERRTVLEKKDKKRKEALKKKVSAGRKGGMRSVLGDMSGGFE